MNEPRIAKQLLEALDVMPKVQALLEGMKAGGTLQIKIQGSRWQDVPEATIDLFNRIELYRLKPSQRRIWVNYGGAGPHVFDSEAEAKDNPHHSITELAVPFIEVMP